MKESHVSAVSGGLSIFGVMRSQNEKSHFLRNLCIKAGTRYRPVPTSLLASHLISFIKMLMNGGAKHGIWSGHDLTVPFLWSRKGLKGSSLISHPMLMDGTIWPSLSPVRTSGWQIKGCRYTSPFRSCTTASWSNRCLVSSISVLTFQNTGKQMEHHW